VLGPARLSAIGVDEGGAEKVKTVIASFEFLVLNSVKKEEDERREWLEERKKNRQNLNTQGNGLAPLLLTLSTVLITVAFTYVLCFIEDFPLVQRVYLWAARRMVSPEGLDLDEEASASEEF